MIESAVIVAVGNNAHQSQLTYNRPRPMLPALGRPMVVRLMDRLYRAGIRRYVVIVGETEGEVAAYLSTHWLPNVKIEFVLKLNGESLFRTLIDVAKQQAKPFLITSYNAFTHGNFPGTMLKRYSDEPSPELLLTGAAMSLSKGKRNWYVRAESGRAVEILREAPEGKPILLTDMAICGQAFVDYLCGLTDQPAMFNKHLADIFQQYVQSGGAANILETAWTLPIETDIDLLTLNRHLLEEAIDAHILSELPWTVQVIPPVRIDPQVSVGQGAKIGPNVYLERGCSVGHEAIVKNTIVLGQGAIPAGDQVADVIVSTRGRISG